jgi:3-polyprenyl-4-hydroxybenzoate decarboxylase
MIVGIPGASGGVKRLRALQLLRNSGVETYLTISRTVELTFAREPRFLKS